MAEGRGGVVKKFLDHTTPSARANVASRLFLFVQPPLLLRRGDIRFFRIHHTAGGTIPRRICKTRGDFFPI